MTHPALPRPDRTVFIVTYGRSGSTLLQNMINALPGHLLRGENANALAPLARLWHEQRLFYPEQLARMRKVGLPSRPVQPWFGYETLDVDALGQGLADVFLAQVLQPAPDTSVIGFKEIRWHEDPALFAPMLDFLARFMPGARFVFNTRDHAAVCRSGWWASMDPAHVRAELTRAETLYADWQAAHPEISLALHYDDYVTGPEAWRALFAFLDVPFDEGLVRAVLDRRLTHLQPR